MTNPIALFEQLRETYLRYLDSPFDLRYEPLVAERRDILGRDGRLYRDPLIEPVPPYLSSDRTFAAAADVVVFFVPVAKLPQGGIRRPSHVFGAAGALVHHPLGIVILDDQFMARPQIQLFVALEGHDRGQEELPGTGVDDGAVGIAFGTAPPPVRGNAFRLAENAAAGVIRQQGIGNHSPLPIAPQQPVHGLLGGLAGANQGGDGFSACSWVEDVWDVQGQRLD